jgi:hypothetical protein
LKFSLLCTWARGYDRFIIPINFSAIINKFIISPLKPENDHH